jgi:phage gp29-like protein
VTLLDYRGNPIQTSSLTKELSEPSLSTVRSIWYDSVATGLTPELLAQIIMEVDQNDITNYLTLAEEMEERDLHYHSVLATRKLAVSGLDVVVEAHSDDEKDVEIADFVRLAVGDDAFGPLIDNSMDAIGKGFSVSEIMWDRTGPKWFPVEYRWRDPRHFTFDMGTGRELRLLDQKDPAMGIPLAPFKFVTHIPRIKTGLPIRGGLARLAVVAYMCKGFAIKDWMAFAEVYGMPLRLGKYSPAATEAQKNALRTAVASIGTDTAAIIPESMVIEFIEGAKRVSGEDIFQALANWLDKQVSKGVLGQTATTEGTPGKLGAEDAQNQVRADIRQSDAGQLAATLRRDVLKPLVDLNFGPLERGTYPKLRIFTEEGEDLATLGKALPPFIDRGLAVQASVIRDKFGLPEPDEGADILQAGKKPGEPDAEEQDERESGGPGPHPGPDGEHGPPFGKPRPGHGPDAMQRRTESTVDPDDIPADDGDEATLQREQRTTVVELMRRVRRGEELTADQRVLLVAYAPRFQENRPTTVQSLVFSKDRFQTAASAQAWAREHGYKDGSNPGVDETEDSWRIRQRDPGDFDPKSFRTIELTAGVKAVIGKLRATLAQEAATAPNDFIDDLVDDQVDGWRKLMDPVFKPILDHANASDGYQDFLSGLEGVLKKMDSTAFAESLAVAAFKARGQGDATDDTD